MFDIDSLPEIRKKMKRVQHPSGVERDGSLFLIKNDTYLGQMKNHKRDLISCWITDEKERALFALRHNWGPERSSDVAWKGGEKVVYRRVQAASGFDRVELVVDCRRPDLERKVKGDRFALRLSLTERVGLSERARAEIVNKSMRTTTRLLKCTNKVQFTDPGKVRFSPEKGS
ncbi:hypothetical protein E0L36_14705 [Streptomyces sp. AJS327]|uniref:hypothetical protein n=1 Tax=Streptomyces sp. AJS327 TaxID=2545265 RepID=UPI0015DE0281|nr:hypothetical protein [Streptomyces sp. AJS327]MBA0052106.1 hypothetical protein [Streptomyces sp. AJS327]